MVSSTFPGGSPPPSESSGSAPANIALHVLCPSMPRFTLHDLPRSTTVAGLKTRISQSIPSQPSPESQRLIYRGKPLVNQNEILQGILEPPGEPEYSIHLVLPPAPAPSAPSSNPPAPIPAQELAGANPMQRNPLFAASRFAMPNFPQAQGMRFRGPVPPPPRGNEVDLGLALRRNVEAIRRQVEMQERGSSQTRPTSQATATTTSSDSSTSNLSSTSLQQPAFQQSSSNPSISATPQYTPSATTTTSLFTMPSSASTARSSVADSELSDFSDSQQFRLQILRHQIALGEDQLSRGIAPPFDHIVRMRTQLFQLLDDQYRNPLARRDGAVESLLTRVHNMYTRADQLRVMQTRSAINLQNNLPGAATNPDSSAPLYLLSSPDGYQGLVASPGGAGAIQASLAALRAGQAPGATMPLQGTGNLPDAHANQNAAVMENVVRQAVLNHRFNNDHQLGLARTIRRMWLFVRLYFFCYMFSEPGTWTRILFVCLAVIVSLLSDTGIPQRLHRMLVAPVQRHMEGVMEQPQRRAAAARQATVDPSSTRTQDRRGQQGQPTGLRHSVRRAERSLLFFLASLIPGASERYIAVTSEAEARNAQRAREEEENRRRQEEANNRAEDNDQFHDAQDTANSHAHPDRDATTANTNETNYDTQR